MIVTHKDIYILMTYHKDLYIYIYILMWLNNLLTFNPKLWEFGPNDKQ